MKKRYYYIGIIFVLCMAVLWGCKGQETPAVSEEKQEENTECQHLFEDWSAVSATCQQTGSRTRACKKCEKEEREDIPVTGHIADESGKTCQFCGLDFPYEFALKDLGTEVETHTDLQLQYLSGDSGAILSYAQGVEELGLPRPVSFSWEVHGGSAADYTVQLSLTEDFSNPVNYRVQGCQADIYNLQIAATYYWRVQMTDAQGNLYCSQTSTFTTGGTAPRAIYVDGVSNVRDMGGWVNEDGVRIRQGMMYRSGQLNMNKGKSIENTITEAGIKTMTEELGIRTELDLRSGTGKIKSSPLPDAAYIHYPMKLEVTFLTDYADDICEIFHMLANEENYPIDMHCVIGTDRTGAMSYLIHGLLGMTEEDLERDYLYSNFANIGGERTMDNIDRGYMSVINEYEGDTLSEKIYNCLVDIGVPKTDLDAVRMIMLEE